MATHEARGGEAAGLPGMFAEPLERRILFSGDVLSDAAGGPLPGQPLVWAGFDAPASIQGEGMSGAADGINILSGVPAYIWRHGCGPTAAGIVLGYWDLRGFANLVPGDASTQTTAVNEMIASTAHYNDYALPIDSTSTGLLSDKSTTGGAHTSNSVADFMRTSWSSRSNYYGWSWSSDVPAAMDQYANLAGYGNATASRENWGSFTWADFVAEIDAGRPMVFLVDSDANGSTDHFVPAIGYDAATTRYACYNTWDSSLHWYSFQQMGSGRSFGIYDATYFNPGPAAPTDISLSNAVVAELAPADTVVGAFSTTDANGGTFTYGLVGGDGSTDNASFTIVGNELKTNAVFDYATQSSYSIRVRTTDSDGLYYEEILAITVTDAVPAVTLVSINDNNAQRSMLVTLEVVFSERVLIADGALDVLRTNGLHAADVSVDISNPLGDQKTWQITFSEIGAIGHSLPDGMYNVVALASGVHDFSGNPLSGDYTRRFHRLFGDADGDRDVDNADLAQFRKALNRPGNYSAYWYFDFDGDLSVTGADYVQLKSRLVRKIAR